MLPELARPEDAITFKPQTFVVVVAIALVLGSVVTWYGQKAFSPPGPTYAAAGVVRADDDEMMRLHRAPLERVQAAESRLEKIESLQRAVCLMFGDFTKASPVVMAQCR